MYKVAKEIREPSRKLSILPDFDIQKFIICLQVTVKIFKFLLK